MSNEIKEILEYYRKYMSIKDCIKLSKIEDYITNLQQENEYLKMNNPEQNMEHFKIINENKRKINNLRAQNIDLQQENERLNQLIKSLRGNIKDITKTSSNRKKAILDLMKKIEKLKKEIEFLKTSPFLFLKIEDDDLVRSYAFMKKELKDYKLRVEKAIEYIKENVAVYAFNNKELPHWEFNDDNINDLLNILQGGKDDNN